MGGYCHSDSPQDAPEVLFRRIEDCQEVHILGEDPYTAQQLLNNSVRLLLQCGLYTRDFEDWDRKIAADKIWTNLKTFIQECYMHRLNASSITAGSQGYVQNAFAALGEESDEDDDDTQTVITQMAALTTQSQLTANTMAETHTSVTAAINISRSHKLCGIIMQPRKPAIPPTHAVADTGATSVFVLKGTKMKNIRPAGTPLIIDLPDGTVV